MIFVKYEDDAIVFSTIEDRLKTRNMRRDPRVSLLLLSAAGNYVEVRGRADIAPDPEKALLREMYDRYMGGTTPPPEPEAVRLIVRVHPERFYVWPPRTDRA